VKHFSSKKQQVDVMCCCSGCHDNVKFTSNHDKLEKTFEALSQVLDNFTAKVCNARCHSFSALKIDSNYVRSRPVTQEVNIVVCIIQFLCIALD